VNQNTLRSRLAPELLFRIRELDLKARLVVEGFLTGLHRSPFHGFSVEFAEYRAYMPGDDVRRIDWKLLARTDRHYVKEYEEETNLRANILLDTSASMGYHSRGTSDKLEYGRCLAAALSYLLLHQHDAVGLALFGRGIGPYLPPRSRRSHWGQILKALEAAVPSGRTDFGRILSDFSGHVRRRGLVIVISDLWDDPRRVISALKHLRHLKHEMLVLHLLDPDELRLPTQGQEVLVDMESGDELEVDILAAEGFRRAAGRWTERLGRECRRHLIDYQPIITDQPFDQALLRYLHKRERLG
jgi:uncharacterized protein (DUF58 family)